MTPTTHLLEDRGMMGDGVIDIPQMRGWVEDNGFAGSVSVNRVSYVSEAAVGPGSALVADDGIYRHDIVSTTVVRALMQVQLETGVPVISAVLTPHHFHEHAEHRKYFLKNFAVKGTEAAMACLQTVAGLRSLGVGG